MANGFNNSTTKRIQRPGENTNTTSKLGSRRIFAPLFKLQVLDSYRNDSDCKGNQRATARKYNIHRRQIQKWLQAEDVLRGFAKNKRSTSPVQPLDCSTGKRSPLPMPFIAEPVAPSCAPVDLSLRKPMSPPPPAAWDLSWKPPVSYDLNWNLSTKCGYEMEAPPPPPPAAAPVSKPFKLFRPFLDDDNFEEVELPCPPAVQPCEATYAADLPSPCGSAFEQVVPGHSPLSPYSYECDMSPLCCGTRPRQTYSVDFKVHNNYYQDSECRINLRTVNDKYPLNKQMHRWLQQEEDLRRTDLELMSS